MFVFVFAVAALAAAHGDGSEVWGSAELQAFISNYEGPAERDPFSPVPPATEDGRLFRLTFKLEQRRGASSGRYTWEYDLPAQQMKFSIMPETFTGTVWSTPTNEMRDFISMDYRGFNLASDEIRESGGRRSNAFGVEADVTTTRIESAAIAEFAPNYAVPPPFPKRYLLEVIVPASPEEARAMSVDVEVVVEGELKAFDGLHSVVCGTNYYGPTVRNPNETVMRTCAAAVDVERVALQRVSTGETLGVWSQH
ncbi:hypothetical protein [uncultured Paracoccus sp.]|uniref:hypothetical protein n=1 Tax=uncultured Paracoccus sp. TaxID=189685 RepID=UPI002600BEAC|nr:hypothetical protein [uncultured Paracoccus sp.]